MAGKLDQKFLIRKLKELGIASEEPVSQGCPNYICFSTMMEETDRVDFYALPIGYTFGSKDGVVVTDFDSPSNKSPRSLATVGTLEPFYSTTDIPYSATFAASGSSLFCIGGIVTPPKEYLREPSSTMYRLETTGSSTNKGGFFWSEIKMLSPRALPSAIAMGGKLYIIGGYLAMEGQVPCGGHWAEVFDPSSGSSIPLPPPPSLGDIRDRSNFITAALHSSKQIFVASRRSGVAYLYNVVDGTWEQLDANSDYSYFQLRQAAVVGKATLCWYQDSAHQLVAYDLDHKMWFHHPIRGLEKFGTRSPRLFPCLSSLFALDGNHLCLIWRDYCSHPRTGGPVFHFTKVRVSICLDAQGKPTFDAFAVSSKSCVLKHNASLCSGLTFPGEVGDGCTKVFGLCGPSWAPFQGSPQGGCGVGNSIKRGETSHPRGMGFKRRETCRVEGSCFKCGETGHMARDCNNGGGNVSFRRGGTGHMARYPLQVGRS